MGFWKNVDDELQYQGLERKVLASQASFDVSYIGKGIRRDSIPAADLALRISKVLNVSLEYLLGIPESSVKNTKNTSPEYNKALHLYHKYANFLDELEKLNQKERETILSVIETISYAHQTK